MDRRLSGFLSPPPHESALIEFSGGFVNEPLTAIALTTRFFIARCRGAEELLIFLLMRSSFFFGDVFEIDCQVSNFVSCVPHRYLERPTYIGQ